MKLLSAVIAVARVAAECPTDWSEVDGKCFRMGPGDKNFEDAKASCAALHEKGILASIENEVQNDWVAARGGSSTFFGGVNPDDHQVWVDMNGIALTWFKWGSGEPNGGAGSQSSKLYNV